MFRLALGYDTKLSRLCEDQAAIISAMDKAVPEIKRLHSVVCDAADQIQLHMIMLKTFYERYIEVRDKLFAQPSLPNCLRRKFGYKSRKTLLKDAELCALLNPMIKELQELAKQYKRLDETRLVRSYNN